MQSQLSLLKIQLEEAKEEISRLKALPKLSPKRGISAARRRREAISLTRGEESQDERDSRLLALFRVELSGLRQEFKDLKASVAASVNKPRVVSVETPSLPPPLPRRCREGRVEPVVKPAKGKKKKGDPPPKDTVQVPWSQVVGRKATKKERKEEIPPNTPKGVQGGNQERKEQGAKGLKKKKKEKKKAPKLPRPPKTAALTVKVLGSGEYTTVDALKEAKANIDLAEIGIQQIGCKRSRAGAFMIEIPGAGAAEKADNLAKRMTDLLGPKGVEIGRPQKVASVRLRGLDPSTTPDEVAKTLAEICSCPPERVEVGKVHSTHFGSGTIIVKCPLAGARKLAGLKKVRVGWMTARVEILTARPLRCYVCLERGHIAKECKSEVDRSKSCYNCSQTGHLAEGCTAPPRCDICERAGRPANHRIGATSCMNPVKGKIRQSDTNKKEVAKGSKPPSAGATKAPTTTKKGKGSKEVAAK